MERQAGLLNNSDQSRLSEQERRLRETEERMRLNLEARRICVELNEKRRASRPISDEAGIVDEGRLREEVHRRFRIVNPAASETDFETYWLTILDDLSRQRAQHLLAEKIKELHSQMQC